MTLLITHHTSSSVKESIDCIETILKEKKITIFARISHSEAAKKVGLTMQDEELIIFGNPQVGTALMIENPTIGIELPLKIIAWHDKDKTIIAYHDLDKIAALFAIKKSENIIKGLKDFLDNLIKTVINLTERK